MAVLDDGSNDLLKRIGDWISERFGWMIGSVKSHKITGVKYLSLRGSLYQPLVYVIKRSSYLPLTPGIKDRRGLQETKTIMIVLIV